MAATICIDLFAESEPVVLELVPVPGRARRRDVSRFVRRRLAVVVAVFLGLLLAFQLAVSGPASQGAASGVGPALSEGAVYVVQPGDTLWSIANAIAPGTDVREAVDRLAELNGGAGLEVGQRLRLQ